MNASKNVIIKMSTHRLAEHFGAKTQYLQYEDDWFEYRAADSLMFPNSFSQEHLALLKFLHI